MDTHGLRVLLTVVVIALLVPPALGAQKRGNKGRKLHVITEVTFIEDARRAALIARDGTALAKLVAPDAVYVHSTGIAQTRDELVEMVTHGDVRYVDFKVEAVAYRTYGSTVIGVGVQEIEATKAGAPIKLRNRYTVVYASINGTPRLVSYQSTELPAITVRETAP